MPLLQVTGLCKYFVFGRSIVRAVDSVSFEVEAGSTLGLVGESGCGKTTTARCVLRLIEPDRGSIVFDGTEMTILSGRRLRALRQRIQIVFQSPRHCLDGSSRIGWIVEEGLRIQGAGDRRARRRKVLEALECVGLSPSLADRFPHEVSGGQLQRAAIARALVLQPRLIILDEPVSALDVSVRAHVLNLLRDIQSRFGLAYIMIGHDLPVVRFMSSHMAVMYLGQIVESACSTELFEHPLHPYTQTLLKSVPQPDPARRGERQRLRGEPPSPLSPPAGCSFHTRCDRAEDRCRRFTPELIEARPGHFVACRLYGESEDPPAQVTV